MAELFDEISRIVATPIPRREAFKLVANALIGGGLLTWLSSCGGNAPPCIVPAVAPAAAGVPPIAPGSEDDFRPGAHPGAVQDGCPPGQELCGLGCCDPGVPCCSQDPPHCGALCVVGGTTMCCPPPGDCNGAGLCCPKDAPRACPNPATGAVVCCPTCCPDGSCCPFEANCCQTGAATYVCCRKDCCCVPDTTSGFMKCITCPDAGPRSVGLAVGDDCPCSCDECCCIRHTTTGGGKFLDENGTVSLLRLSLSGSTASTDPNSFSDFTNVSGELSAFNFATRTTIEAAGLSAFALQAILADNAFTVAGASVASVNGVASPIVFYGAKTQGGVSFRIRDANTLEILAGGVGEPERADFELIRDVSP